MGISLQIRIKSLWKKLLLDLKIRLFEVCPDLLFKLQGEATGIASWVSSKEESSSRAQKIELTGPGFSGMASIFRSTLSADDIPALVYRLYRLKVRVIKELSSYDDQNFLVEEVDEGEDCSGGKCPDRVQFVVKVLNSLDSRKPSVIEQQTRLIEYVRQAGYPTPGPLMNGGGQYQQLVDLSTTRSKHETFIVRLFEYIPGVTLAQVRLTLKLCYQLGVYAGWMDQVLATYPNVDDESLKLMVRKWNMSEIPALRQQIQAVPYPDQVELTSLIIDQFEGRILSCQDKFSKGLIHGDFNDFNIVVDGTDLLLCSENAITSPVRPNTQDTTNIIGVIDFGDATFSLYIFEVAIAMTYVMINQHGIPPLQAAGQVLAGYLSRMTLTQVELDHLKLCICSRFVQSLVMGYFSFSQDPGNDYILTHAKRVWPMLKSLWETPDSDFLAQIKNSHEHLKF
ncbi:hydroxylysine kinase-like [Physella acuta]|uniref:hydroxylysine kinase-like n=1 Tax=Physella acuta TaxID=109671 RepID=UPI0027DD4A2E|nr:hydroxylysine kinase-like [Physella acuta]